MRRAAAAVPGVRYKLHARRRTLAGNLCALAAEPRLFGGTGGDYLTRNSMCMCTVVRLRAAVNRKILSIQPQRRARVPPAR